MRAHIQILRIALGMSPTEVTLLSRARGVDLDVAIYMGLDMEDIEAAGEAGPLLAAQWRIFNALEDPTRQTAVINMDGMHPPPSLLDSMTQTSSTSPP